MRIWRNFVDFETLKGKTLVAVEKYSNTDDYLIFKTSDEGIYLMAHEQECCESVYIDDICGDFQSLIEEEILVAEELNNDASDEGCSDVHCTWTFYHLETVHGDVTIKWFGTSNGYYSESAKLYKISESDYERIKKGKLDLMYEY